MIATTTNRKEDIIMSSPDERFDDAYSRQIVATRAIRLMSADQRESLLDQLDNIAVASDSMVARLITETLPDPEALLPYVLRRLLELEAEVGRLRAAVSGTDG